MDMEMLVEELDKDEEKKFHNISELMKYLLRVGKKQFFNFKEAIEFIEKILKEE